MLIPATDVAIVAGLLSDPANHGSDANELARTILKAIYANDSEKSISATRGIVVVQPPNFPPWAVGPFPTVSSAVKAAVEGKIRNSGFERIIPMRLVHPNRGEF